MRALCGCGEATEIGLTAAIHMTERVLEGTTPRLTRTGRGRWRRCRSKPRASPASSARLVYPACAGVDCSPFPAVLRAEGLGLAWPERVVL